MAGAPTRPPPPSARRGFAEAAARLAAIVDSSDDAIVSKTLDGIITSWNPAAERMFGWTAAEAVGRPIILIIPEARRAEEDTVLARVRRGERVEHFDTVRVTKDGRLVDVSVTVSPVRDVSGRIVGASKIARDISDRRRIDAERAQFLARERAAREEAERANRAKDEFLATVSHELRTPLNGVFGCARMLQSADMDEQTRQRALAAIVRGAAAHARLIEDLLDVSRMVAGNLRLDLRLVDLRHVIEAALETILPAAAAKAIAIEADLDGTPAAVLGGDGAGAEGREGPAERVGMVRLLQMLGDPRSEDPRTGGLVAVGGRRDDRNVRHDLGGQPLQFPNEPVAILADHGDVADDG